jgi:hypothetical protein
MKTKSNEENQKNKTRISTQQHKNKWKVEGETNIAM